MTESKPELFKQAVSDSIRSRVKDARKVNVEGKPDKNISLALGEVSPAEPAKALKAIDEVIEAIEKGGERLTLEDVDNALDISDELIEWVKKDASREKREAKKVESDLSFGEKAWKFVGGKSDRINKARKEAKEADKASGRLERSRDQNTELDEAIDTLIINELAEISPSFATIMEAEKDINSVMESLDGLDGAADSLDTAGVIDMADADSGNQLLNMSMEMADNMLVEGAKAEVSQAVASLNRALKKFDGLHFEDVSTEFMDLINMIDIPLDMLDTGAGFGIGDSLDLIGAFETMDKASDVRDAVNVMRDDFEKRLRKIEESITSIVGKVRKDLKIE